MLEETYPGSLQADGVAVEIRGIYLRRGVK